MSRTVVGYIGPIRAKDLRLGNLAFVEPNTKEWRPSRMSEGELLGFVADVAADRILLGHQVQPFEDLGNVFPAVAFLADTSLDARRQVGACYEYRDRASGKTGKGNPHFTTVQFIHVEDWKRARDLIAAVVVNQSRKD